MQKMYPCTQNIPLGALTFIYNIFHNYGADFILDNITSLSFTTFWIWERELFMFTYIFGHDKITLQVKTVTD